MTISISLSPEMKVVCVGKEYCDPDFHVARNDFSCFDLEFVSNGAGNLFLNGRQYPSHAGVLFFKMNRAPDLLTARKIPG